ncbi:MAG: SURF1 family protein [Ilumatobacteraceae bacterium]
MVTDPAEPPSGAAAKYRFLVAPKWIAFHLLVVVLVVTMINLALWQLRRLDQRQEFNSRVRTNESQPIAPLDDLRSAITDPSTVEWRRVKVTGTFVPDHEFLVVNRSQNGDVGRNVVDALRLNDGSFLLVNRGFVPDANDVPPVPQGPVELKGRLRASERRATGQAADESSGVLVEIRRIDIDVLAKQFDSTILPMYVEQLDSVKPLQPIVGPTLDEGPHLSYTIQWFIFSVCVIVGWVLAVRRSIGTRSGKVTKKRRSSYVPIAGDE